MKYLTHCLALGALLILHFPAGAIVIDTHAEQEVYDVPDFLCYVPVVSEDITPEPEAESEVFVDTPRVSVHGSGAEKPVAHARKPAKDYG